MRAVLQRVSEARVTVEGKAVSSIGRGMVVLLGIGAGDTDRAVDWMVEKILHLRFFPDEADKMNRSLMDIRGEMIVVSQFTLYGDCRKGRRPSFVQAMEPVGAEHFCNLFVDQVRAQGVGCHTGVFRANMQVSLTNEGPVTLLVDSALSRREGLSRMITP